MELVLLWYPFLGLVWAYLLCHEYHQKHEMAADWAVSKFGCIRRVIYTVVFGVTLWPLSLYRHFRHRNIRRLFE